jgi:hypothetical protein
MFDPDWCVAPAATLRDWMEENEQGPGDLATGVTRGCEKHLAEATRLVEDVLSRRPLTERHAWLLEQATGIRARFWRAHEGAYRDGLARGLKDVTAV